MTGVRKSKCTLSHLGPKPKVKEDDFEDLLSTQGFGSKPDRRGPRTIAEMRKQEMSRDMDPLKLQVQQHPSLKAFVRALT